MESCLTEYNLLIFWHVPLLWVAWVILLAGEADSEFL